MASAIDAFNEAFADKLAIIKFAIYGIPVYYCITLFIKGQMAGFYTLASFTTILLLGMMTCAINNVRENKQEVVTLNPLQLGWVTAKTAVAVIPMGLILWGIGTLILKLFPIPEQLVQLETAIKIIVWSLIGAFMFTSYLSYAKFLQVKQAYNLQVIADSCIDMLVNLCFFVPQLLLADAILLSPLFYAVYYFNVPYDHFVCIAYCSMVIVANVSIIANYFAQAAYEIIKGRDGDYDNKHNLSYLDVDDTEKANL